MLTKSETRTQLRRQTQQWLAQLQITKNKFALEEAFNFAFSRFFNGREGVWGAFYPLPSEPQILTALKNQTHIRWCFPKINNDQLDFYSWNDFTSGERNSLNVIEPPTLNSEPFDVKTLKGFLVPGLGFTAAGARLGRGKGYYDRLLTKVMGEKVGVGFSCQVVDVLPIEEHDIFLDYILTEKGFLRAS